MTWDRVERLIGRDNLQRLAAKRVGVVGVGSGGGFVALSLAMSGVGKFVLVDNERLEAVNVVRHVADHRYVGQHKVEALADLIHQRNPKAEVETHVGRIEDMKDVLDNLDLLIVGVDGENAKYILNEAALERNLTAIYAGVYERGDGGDVVIIHPFDGPCYACWAAELREGVVQADSTEVLDYGMIGPEGTLEAEPGLWLDVVRIAAVQADFAVKQLLNQTGDLPGNTVILANNALEIMEGQITPPQGAVWVNIQRDPNCLICGDKVREAREAAAAAEELSLEDLASSGGIVFDEGEQ